MPCALSSFGRSPLSEQLLLIAIDRRSGRLRDRPPGSLGYAIAGAMLTDLLASGVAALVDGTVVAGDASDSPLAETFLREVRVWPVTRFAVRAVGERERTLTMITSALTSKSAVDADCAALITLVVWCGLLSHVVARSVRRAGRRRVRQIVHQASELAIAMLGQNMPTSGGGGGG